MALDGVSHVFSKFVGLTCLFVRFGLLARLAVVRTLEALGTENMTAGRALGGVLLEKKDIVAIWARRHIVHFGFAHAGAENVLIQTAAFFRIRDCLVNERAGNVGIATIP